MKSHIVTAKIFWNGGSQAVRLPKECRFPTMEVTVHKEGNRVILEPHETKKWPSGYWKKLEQFAAAGHAELDPISAWNPTLLDLSDEEL